eukprot:TRINITY_DN2904_c0_g1_i1.p1 TRINITY_DN2904_c0_g1~~TRINITY_DN2904_c0_g1_i1.p1  ORF type:complete len:629 (+),score=124.93 TRINITY_DN2904_c0_g1_i1:64-1950(+)
MASVQLEEDETPLSGQGKEASIQLAMDNEHAKRRASLFDGVTFYLGPSHYYNASLAFLLRSAGGTVKDLLASAAAAKEAGGFLEGPSLAGGGGARPPSSLIVYPISPKRRQEVEAALSREGVDYALVRRLPSSTASKLLLAVVKAAVDWSTVLEAPQVPNAGNERPPAKGAPESEDASDETVDESSPVPDSAASRLRGPPASADVVAESVVSEFRRPGPTDRRGNHAASLPESSTPLPPRGRDGTSAPTSAPPLPSKPPSAPYNSTETPLPLGQPQPPFSSTENWSSQKPPPGALRLSTPSNHPVAALRSTADPEGLEAQATAQSEGGHPHLGQKTQSFALPIERAERSRNEAGTTNEGKTTHRLENDGAEGESSRWTQTSHAVERKGAKDEGEETERGGGYGGAAVLPSPATVATGASLAETPLSFGAPRHSSAPFSNGRLSGKAARRGSRRRSHADETANESSSVQLLESSLPADSKPTSTAAEIAPRVQADCIFMKLIVEDNPSASGNLPAFTSTPGADSFGGYRGTNLPNFKKFRKVPVLTGTSFRDFVPFAKDPYREAEAAREAATEFMQRERQQKQKEKAADELFNADKLKRKRATADTASARGGLPLVSVTAKAGRGRAVR